MAKVLAAGTAQGYGNDPLRRTSSQPSLLLDTNTQAHAQAPSQAHSRANSDARQDYRSDYKSEFWLAAASRSPPSSAQSSPPLTHNDFSNYPSYISTPSSSLTLEDDYEDDYDDQDEHRDAGAAASAYGMAKPSSPPAFHKPLEATPTGSPRKKETGEHTATTESESNSVSRPTTARQHISEPTSGSPPRDLVRTNSITLASIADDFAAKPQPSRHVDYLSHDWKEEDIWTSWRHVVRNRGRFDNCARLENASWRTWMKSQRRLATINPDKLNWMKDHDVTWLYGPLLTGTSHIQDLQIRGALSRNDSFVGKKPILKRRTVSEVMLQRSISSQSLMRQATDLIRAQVAAYRSAGPTAGERRFSDIVPGPSPVNSSNDTVPETPSPMASYASSDSGTGDDTRHIHFNETVEQCIAISSDGDEEVGLDETVISEDDDHSSDEEFLTMRTDRTIERKLSRSNTPRNSFSEGCASNKTIAMLPATRLKYRDTPELAPQKDPQAGLLSGLRGSSSQETLRPTKPHANFLLDDEDDLEDLDPEWTLPTRSNSIQSPPRGTGGTHVRFGDGSAPRQVQSGLDVYRDDNDELQHRNMRRTPSGMFMPYEEGDEKMSAEGEGLFGKVYDTYNTARDIAHVIWNVGWRR